jgi:hypothetical protein
MIHAILIDDEWLCFEMKNNVWIVQSKNNSFVNLIYIDRVEHYISAIKHECDPFNLKYELLFEYNDDEETFKFCELYCKFLKSSLLPSEINIFFEKLSSNQNLREKYLDFFLFNPDLFKEINSNYPFFNSLKSWMGEKII